MDQTSPITMVKDVLRSLDLGSTVAEFDESLEKYLSRMRLSTPEHNLETLTTTLGLDGEQLQAAIRQLVDVGFLEGLRESWKVPMLHRDGLEVRQGKVFAPDQPASEE